MTISLGDYKKDLENKTVDSLKSELNSMLSAICDEKNQYALFGYQYCAELITYELHDRIFNNAA